MTSFHFRLEKVLGWRRTQLELEEARFRRQSAALEELDRQRARLQASIICTEAEIRSWAPLTGGDLAALDGFRLRVRKEEKALAARRSAAEQKLEIQRKTMLEARRRYRLLERLSERRLVEWQAARDIELEQLASESHLAALARRSACAPI